MKNLPRSQYAGTFSKPKVTLHKLDWLEWTSIVLCIWLIFYPYPYRLIFLAVLALPILGLLLNGVSRPSLASLVSISNKKGKNSYDVADFIEFPGMALGLRVLLDFEYESFFSIVKVGTVGFAILILLLVTTHKLVAGSEKNKGVIYFTIVFNIALYSYASTYGINCVFDDSKSKVYKAKVIGKHTSTVKTRTIYYLKVEPWGHHKDPEDIKVSSSFYSKTEVGGTVTIDYKEGLLKIPWYTLRRAPVADG